VVNNENRLIPKPVRVLECFRDTPEDFTLTLDLPLQHEPGQFVQLSLFGVGEAPISIASWGGDELVLHVREVGNVTRALSQLRRGDTVFVRGPYGNGYPMAEARGRNLVLAGGGCGCAPLKGVIEYVLRHRDAYGEMSLFWGFRNAKLVFFREQLEEWRKLLPVYISLDTLEEGEYPHAQEGFVSDVMSKTEIPKGNTWAFLCGPPIMMRVVTDVLRRKGLRDDQVFASEERLMYCAIGQCCHCMISGKYTCVDGPVFRWDLLLKETTHV
jgi:NAD(P)H-flavin reductase